MFLNVTDEQIEEALSKNKTSLLSIFKNLLKEEKNNVFKFEILKIIINDLNIKNSNAAINEAIRMFSDGKSVSDLKKEFNI